jgi:membrane associated rhomboid family serine protease
MLPISDDISSRDLPVASWTIIGLCITAYFWQLLPFDTAQNILNQWGFIPKNLFPSEFVPPDAEIQSSLPTLITYMFIHAGPIHLLSNLLFLWIFSASVEGTFGHPGFVIFYLLCGVVAAIGQFALEPNSIDPVVGASGAISGVLGAYLLLFPRAEITMIVPILFVVRIVSLPAWIVLIFWFGIQILYLFGSEQHLSNIAFAAHLTGFVTGFLLAAVFTRIFRLNY